MRPAPPTRWAAMRSAAMRLVAMRQVMRWVQVGVGLTLALVLVGCTAPRPDVSFYGDRKLVKAAPLFWCRGDTNTGFSGCVTEKANRVQLRLGPGDPVLVELPTDVADAPWQVYARYLDPAGKPAEVRSTLFSDGRLTYTLRPPGSGSRLTYVEVQALPVPVQNTDGTSSSGNNSGSGSSTNGGGANGSGIDFAFTRTWGAVIEPAEG